MIGRRFERLKVIAVDRSTQYGYYYKCLCNCGKIKIARGTHLRYGNIKSCGCLSRDVAIMTHTRHGVDRADPTYSSWAHMKQRCLNHKHKGYKYYMGRGISVCSRWLNSFENFLKDMGPRPKNRSLDRINNDGNYEPGNCRWATSSEQNKNKKPRGFYKDCNVIVREKDER